MYPRPSSIRIFPVVLGLLLGLGLLSLARAGEEETDPDLSIEGTFRLGPFHIRPSLKIKNAGVDDNVFLDPRIRERDVTATLGPGIDAILLAGDRGGLHLFQEFDYVAFQTFNELNHWNSYTRARGILLLKKLSLSLQDEYTSIRERPNFEIDRRFRQERNTIEARVHTRDLGRLGAGIVVRQSRIDFAEEDVLAPSQVSSRLNRDERSVTLRGEVRILPKTTLLLEAVFEDVDVLDPGELRDTRSTTYLPGIRFDPTASIQGELKIGIKNLQSEEQPGNDFLGTVGEGSLRTRLGSRGRLRGTLSRNLVLSSLDNNVYFLLTTGSLGYEHFFTRHWSTDIEVGRSDGKYPNEVTRTGGQPFQGIRIDRVKNYKVGIRYRMSDQVTISLQALRQQRDSTDDFFDDERNFYNLGAIYKF